MTAYSLQSAEHTADPSPACRIPDEEVAFGLIKPGFERNAKSIMGMICSSGLVVIYACPTCLTPEAVDVIYQNSQEEHFYKAMKEYLIGKQVVAMIITGCGPESQNRLNGLKKSAGGKDGPIRAMFSRDAHISEDEIMLWENQAHPRQDEMTVLLTQRNVLHTSDNNHDAKDSLRAVLGHKLIEHSINGTLPYELTGLAGGL